MKKTKVVRGWNWKVIKQAINEVYDKYHHRDDWGVEVIYRQSMIQSLRQTLLNPQSKVTKKR